MKNNIKSIESVYVTACRTYEVILITNNSNTKVVYIYNYEGVQFRVFMTLEKLFSFANNNVSATADYEFNNEKELNEYLENLDITN